MEVISEVGVPNSLCEVADNVRLFIPSNPMTNFSFFQYTLKVQKQYNYLEINNTFLWVEIQLDILEFTTLTHSLLALDSRGEIILNVK